MRMHGIISGDGALGDQTEESKPNLDQLPSKEEIENKPNNDIVIGDDNQVEITLDSLSTSTLILSN